MSLRQSYARDFYRGDCEAQILSFLTDFTLPEIPSKTVAGIVPHAGWSFSGATAAKVFKCIREKSDPSTFILFGAVHHPGVMRSSIYVRGSWLTPLGEVKIDEEIAATILDSAGDHFVEDKRAHMEEHSIEVQLPFIKYFFPSAEIVPIAVPPNADSHLGGLEIGKILANSEKEIIVVGTTDLTHYGDSYFFTPAGYGPKALAWMKSNDSRMIDLALKMKAEQIVKEAATHHNACGAGAIAATIFAAKGMGAERGSLIEYTTSYDLSPKETVFRMGVGYVGIVF